MTKKQSRITDYDSTEARERFFEIHNNKLDKHSREKVSDSEILMCFNGTGNRLQKVSNIAIALDISESTARRRLKELEEENILYRERVGYTDIWTLSIWWSTPWSERVMNYLESKIRKSKQ